MITLNNVNFKYKNDKILENINLEINNEFVCIIGNNGEGKTTLVKLLSGLLLPTSGDILINNINTKSKKDFLQIRKNVSVVFQNPDNQIIFERVYEELEFTLKTLKYPKEEIEKRIDYALKKVDMKDYKFTNTSELSMGQKQKIIIAEALLTDASIIILDEPTAMLDPKSKKQILNLLKSLDKTIILVTHILDEILYSDKCLYINNKIIQEFKTTNLLKDSNLLDMINNNSNFTLSLISSLLKNGFTFDNLKLPFDENIINIILERLK